MENIMSRRSKENVAYWTKRRKELYEKAPQMKSVKKRYDSIKILLQQKYPWIKEHDNIQMIKDIIYLDREIRRDTEGLEKRLKQKLSQEKQVDLGYTPNYRQDIKKLKTLF